MLNADLGGCDDDDSCSLISDDEDDDGEDEQETEISATAPPATAGLDQDNKNKTGQEEKHTELAWADAHDLFSALDACNFESVGFREFCALVFLLAAAEDNMLL